jgi:hypothetical protein
MYPPCGNPAVFKRKRRMPAAFLPHFIRDCLPD